MQKSSVKIHTVHCFCRYGLYNNVCMSYPLLDVVLLRLTGLSEIFVWVISGNRVMQLIKNILGST